MKETHKFTKILSKAIIYIALFDLAISIIVPVGWVFMASVKRNAEFIGADINPWALPADPRWENFKQAFVDARNGRVLPELRYGNSSGAFPAFGACSSGFLCTGKI